jgi:uncharacterized phage protein gp47/JayE
MTYTPRTYPEIVRDVLTTLTGGTVRETVTVPAGEDPVLVLAKLATRPVRRVSHLQGQVRVGAGTDAPVVDYRFTPADFELVSTDGTGELDAIAFRPGGRRPVPLSEVTVNYYPVESGPTPLTDLNVGSVIRTVVESVARETALTYQHLRHVYDSGFLDTAAGGSLDKVVSLVGVSRLPAGHPVATLRFERDPAAPGRLTVPANTRITDGHGNRYLTVAELTLEPGETARTVTARGESVVTPVLDAGALNRPEVLIAGVRTVVNDEPARALAAAESDDELRRRARAALHGTVRGTTDALRFAVRSVPGVKDVAVTEFPNGIAGEVSVVVAYEQDTPQARAEVDRVIAMNRPAGVRVLAGTAAPKRVDAQLVLTVAGSTVPTGAEAAALADGAVQRVTAALRAVPTGGLIRRTQLTVAALGDPRLVDAVVTLVPAGEPGTQEYQLPQGIVLEVGTVAVTGTVAETPGPAAPTTSTVDIDFPVHLVTGVTSAEAAAALTAAVDGYLAGGSALTVDGLLAAVRDDTRYAAVRAEVIVTVTSGTGAAAQFRQLTDGVGGYQPTTGETLLRGALNLDVREGST